MSATDFMLRVVSKARRVVGIDKEFLRDDLWMTPEQVKHASDENTHPMARSFFDHEGRVVDKWIHYLGVYEKHLAQYRDTDFRMLEIGVFKGGSLEMWREYFGPRATIFGVDINPDCAGYVDPPNQVRIGSQADPAFLRGVAAEMGGLDVVLDDGSHVARHQKASFDALFPLLAKGGLYIIEDAHTAYWPYEFGGGYRRKGSAIELMKQVVDDMHHWYHGRRAETAAAGLVNGVYFYDSIVVIEKGSGARPQRTTIGYEP